MTYHVCNHCVIGKKHLKIYLLGLVMYRDFRETGPCFLPGGVSLFSNIVSFFFFFFFFVLVLHFDKIPLYGVLILSIGGGILVAVLVHFIVSPYLKKKILREVYGDDGERTTSSPPGRTVSFAKSQSASEPGVNAEEKDVKGR